MISLLHLISVAVAATATASLAYPAKAQGGNFGRLGEADAVKPIRARLLYRPATRFRFSRLASTPLRLPPSTRTAICG